MTPGVLAAVIIAGGATILRIGYDPKITDKPGYVGKVIVGIFAAGAVLAIIGSSAPDLASILAVSLVAVSLMLNGKAVMTATGRVLGKG